MLLQNPNWKSTQTDNTGDNSEILRKNLGLAEGDGLEAHHITPSTSPRSQEARDILDEYQIDINSKENGVALTEAQHRKTGLHQHKNIDRVNQRIINAASAEGKSWGEVRNEILEELEIIKNEILNNQFP